MDVMEWLALYLYLVGAWMVALTIWAMRPPNPPTPYTAVMVLVVLLWPVAVPVCAATFGTGRPPHAG